MNPVERIGGRRLLFVMAVEAEYGPHLRTRFTPLMTGVGPVVAGREKLDSWSRDSGALADCMKHVLTASKTR